MTEVATATGQDFAEAAAAWLSDLNRWPTATPQELCGYLSSAPKPDLVKYLGVAACLLMLIAANAGKWPPMSPKAFAAEFRKPKQWELVKRYARNIATVEVAFRTGHPRGSA